MEHTETLSWLLLRFFEDAYALVQKGRLDGWYPDADLYELLIAWMCTQEDLVDTAEQLVRQELLVGCVLAVQTSIRTILCSATCMHWGQLLHADFFMRLPPCRRQASCLKLGTPTHWSWQRR